jgi:hypothetical protein
MRGRVHRAAGLGVRLAAGVAALALATPPAAAALEHEGGQSAARTVRHATISLRDVADAEAAGYGQFLTCVQEAGAGAMGTHWVNGALVGDTALDPERPEALMYETKPSGKLLLVGVEYIVFQAAWDAEHDEAPTLFDQEFHLVTSPNRYGLPPFYALHVWAWKHNPAGTFANWNPRVTCDHAAGDPI